jgi:hypothetical protein
MNDWSIHISFHTSPPQAGEVEIRLYLIIYSASKGGVIKMGMTVFKGVGLVHFSTTSRVVFYTVMLDGMGMIPCVKSMGILSQIWEKTFDCVQCSYEITV